MSHTPAPWAVYAKDEPLDEDGSVCISPNGPEIRPRGGQKLGNEDDDLQLIAAAPELLSALKNLLAYHVAHHNHHAHVMARAAIKKAEGV